MLAPPVLELPPLPPTPASAVTPPEEDCPPEPEDVELPEPVVPPGEKPPVPPVEVVLLVELWPPEPPVAACDEFPAVPPEEDDPPVVPAVLVEEETALLDAFVVPPAAEAEVPLDPPLLALELVLELWGALPPEACVPEERSEAFEQARVEQRSRPSRRDRGCFEIAISKECPGHPKPGHGYWQFGAFCVLSISMVHAQVDVQEAKAVPQAAAMWSWVSMTKTVKWFVPVIVSFVVSSWFQAQAGLPVSLSADLARIRVPSLYLISPEPRLPAFPRVKTPVLES